MATPAYSNTYTLGQFSRTLTGTAIALASEQTFAAKAWISVPTANAAGITMGATAALLPIVIAKATTFEISGDGQHSVRIDLSQLFINGTNNDLVHVTYIA